MRNLPQLMFLVLAVGCASYKDGSRSGLPDTGAGVPAPEEDGFLVADDIDPHVQSLADALAEGGEDVLAWPGAELIPQDYSGLMRAPGGVLAGRMGSSLDLCRCVHQLLSAVDVPSRYVLDGEQCWIEAEVDGEALWVPTSRLDTAAPAAKLERRVELPADQEHRLSLLEETGAGTKGGTKTVLEGPLAELSRGPMVLQYVQDGSAVRLSARLGPPKNLF